MATRPGQIFTGLAIALLLMTAMIDPIYSMATAAVLLIANFVVMRKQPKSSV